MNDYDDLYVNYLTAGLVGLKEQVRHVPSKTTTQPYLASVFFYCLFWREFHDFILTIDAFNILIRIEQLVNLNWNKIELRKISIYKTQIEINLNKIYAYLLELFFNSNAR